LFCGEIIANYLVFRSELQIPLTVNICRLAGVEAEAEVEAEVEVEIEVEGKPGVDV
jgi:hypothetical protein